MAYIFRLDFRAPLFACGLFGLNMFLVLLQVSVLSIDASGCGWLPSPGSWSCRCPVLSFLIVIGLCMPVPLPSFGADFWELTPPLLEQTDKCA